MVIENKKEIWKDIPNYEGFYKASTHGRIKSLSRKIHHYKGGDSNIKERILKTPINQNGYKIVNLYLNGDKKPYKVSVLIAMAFLNHNPNGYKIIVDHKDNVKTNDFLYNLQLISTRENVYKDKKNSTSKYVGVCFFKERKKWKAQIQINGKQKHLGLFDSEIEASNAYQKELLSIK